MCFGTSLNQDIEKYILFFNLTPIYVLWHTSALFRMYRSLLYQNLSFCSVAFATKE